MAERAVSVFGPMEIETPSSCLFDTHNVIPGSRKYMDIKEKLLIILMCVIGLAGVCYGMLRHSNVAFIIGVVFVIGGYLVIRKRLKDHIG
ncbi:MAG: hypothetical protein JRJ65_14640 [Deltaproteobacteria bacterium]|nr:hypothetical protein [Deltaproteobacteria bacterium]